jgi:hypothetical protein
MFAWLDSARFFTIVAEYKPDAPASEFGRKPLTRLPCGLVLSKK